MEREPMQPEHQGSNVPATGDPMLGFLRSIGLTPDMFFAASIGSMLLSLLLWFVPRRSDNDEKGRPERFALFVGLWPPTLFLMGHALREEENAVWQRDDPSASLLG